MDWKQFFASVISALAWPVAVVAVVCLFKTPIKALIDRTRSLKIGEWQADFSKEVEAVKAQISAQNAEAETPSTPAHSPPVTTLELASISPRSAVLMAWLDVEKEINQVIDKHQLRIANAGMSIMLKMRILADHHVIDDQTLSTFKNLYQLRNQAVHLPEVEISLSDAIAMAEACEWLVQKLKETSQAISG